MPPDLRGPISKGRKGTGKEENGKEKVTRGWIGQMEREGSERGGREGRE